MTWQPSYDGELLVEPRPDPHPDSVYSGWHADLPILIGTTRDEWKMFTVTDRKRRSLDDTTLRHYMARSRFGSTTVDQEGAEEAYALYERCEETGRRRRPSQIWVAFQTDRVFRQPAIALANARGTSAHPTYFYRFDWQPSLARDRVGACHSLDVPFTFGTLRHPLLFPLLGWSPSARRLSREIQAAWAAFAHKSDPSCRELPVWPAYEPKHRSTMLLAERPHCVESPGDDARRFWSRVAGD
jgi:para-nitrobenzyl esterase